MEDRKNKTAYWQGQLPKGILCVLCVGVAVLAFAMLVLGGTWDSDTLWIVAVGRDILENGIPYANTLNAADGLGVVLQQWLFCAIAALFDKLGAAGYYLFGTLNAALVVGTAYAYLRHRGQCRVLSLGAALLLSAWFEDWIITPRPEGITIVLLLLECMAVEDYQHDGRWKHLIWLPVTMLLEANLHGSMMWFHWAILLAYLVPCPPLGHPWMADPLAAAAEGGDDRKGFLASLGIRGYSIPRPFTLWSLLMVPAMFATPYGLAGVTYPFDSVLSGMYDWVSIIEMQEPALISLAMVAIVSSLMLAFLAWKDKALCPGSIWLLVGFGVFSCVSLRNAAFLFITILSLLPPLLSRLYSMKDELLASVNRFLGAALAVSALFLGVAVVSQASDAASYFSGNLLEAVSDDGQYEAYAYMAETAEESGESIEDIVLFAGYNTGAYFEFAGLKRVYMDARPELLMESVNGVRDILPEYSALMCTYSVEYDYGGSVGSAIQDYLESYGFDYLFVQKWSEQQLFAYLEGAGEASGYAVAVESDEYVLYERVGG